jgi:hypothetical protein
MKKPSPNGRSAPPRIRLASYLVIHDYELSPEELAARVGLEADEFFRRGDPWLGPGRIPVGKRHSFNSITYKSGLDEEKVDPAEHMRVLLDRLRPYRDRIRALRLLPSSAGMLFWVVKDTDVDHHQIDFDPRDVDEIHSLGASFTVEYYFF